MYCIGKKLCRACAGQMYDKLQIDNIGMTAARVSSTLLNLNMKKFHDSTAKISKININELIL
jgi:uridylate kinase